MADKKYEDKIDILQVGTNQMELVDFRMFELKEDGKIYEGIYGINIAKVKEIIKYPNLIKIPSKDSLIEGIYNLRGEVIPIVSLAKWLGINEPADIKTKKVIITIFNNITVGFIVHDAKRIRRVSWRFVKPPSEVLIHQYGNKIVGTINLDEEHVMIILDFESICEELGIFSEDDIKRIRDTALEGSKDKQKKVKILIADDSATARKIIKTAVEPLAEKIIEAKDGQEAWDMLNRLYEETNGDIEKAVNIIITDVEMPNMDGYRFAKLVKEDERFKKIPVIMNTSLSGNANLQKAKEVGVDDFCTKFIAEEFTQAVLKHI
ncbi:chemotaxis protein [Hippea maritima]|uniref:Response regulator receiver modulated CheW protein n=1 Tax=Hippea maritima (strain ATCC 700847 / DSM 10411 / MH2) TaxID=760142 RepID=F2LTK6_HIPMA|nr:chemotaxis protein [Hippea maritima]AEA33331.1 response regulator receiver modulated CheW protein [Hippea maritima DSM 10411]